MLRQCLHKTGSVWNQYKIGMDKPYVYMADSGSIMDWICYLEPNGSTDEGDPIWNYNISVLNQLCVNRVDLYHIGSDPKWM